MPRVGLMLVNLGTPDSTSVPDVRRYLREFLSDPRVVDIAPVRRWILLNLFILPFRPKVSAAAYRLVWTDNGSPLLVHGQDLAAKMATTLGDGVQVELAMRYQNPSIAASLERFRAAGTDRIVVFPLFPQYSSAAWGSAVEKVFVEANRLWNVPSLNIVPTFHDHPAFIDALTAVARPALADFKPDRIVMSFHGLPERHVVKSDESAGKHCLQSEACCETIVPANRYCYRAQCFATARALADRLGLAADGYDISFQSRLGRSPWIKPYTDLLIRQLASDGVRRVAVLSPAFVADCLETIEEIGIRARKDFVSHGGEDLCLVPSLNSEDAWVKAAVQLVREAEPTISNAAP